MRKIPILFSLTILGFSSICYSGDQSSSEDSCQILFIGSSYFGLNRLPQLFENIALSSSKKVVIDHYTPAGWRLYMHLEDSITDQKIHERDWDYVVLQGVGVTTAYPGVSADEHPLLKVLQAFKKKITANCNSTKMIFCLPWAYEDGMTWYQDWTDEYEDMQIKIYDNTLAYSNSLKFPVAPVGWAWYQVLEEMAYPLHYLHTNDWNHPTLEGSYLMACVIYSTIFRESTVGLACSADITQEECFYFQEVASSTVLDSIELWNINIDQQISEVDQRNSRSILAQNYPNPFSYSTYIFYEINEADFIEISIFDQQGRRLYQLMNDFRDAGVHTLEFNAAELPSGIYYYSIKDQNDFITRKMVLCR